MNQGKDEETKKETTTCHKREKAAPRNLQCHEKNQTVPDTSQKKKNPQERPHPQRHEETQMTPDSLQKTSKSKAGATETILAPRQTRSGMREQNPKIGHENTGTRH
jgi:hypothetical protein